MTAAAGRSETASALHRARNHAHFIGAVVLLAATWTAIHAIGWVEKLPVPWPEGVDVDEGWRLAAGLPEDFGSRFVVVADGGEVVLPPNIVAELGMGTTDDEKRHASRRSNWYVQRLYRDTGDGYAGPDDGLRYWRLGVFYYTGLKDLVPHVPDVCQIAGGAVPGKESGYVTFDLADEAGDGPPEPWRNVEFRRGVFKRMNELGIERTSYAYYVFSVNGEPQTNRNKVRWTLSMPTVTYAFFAKIEVAPAVPSETVAETDRRTLEFLRGAMPRILKALPTARDVERLAEEAERAEQEAE